MNDAIPEAERHPADGVIPKKLLLIAEAPEKEGVLDDLVHDCFSNMASDVNNSGPEAQIKCLRENGFSWKYILEALGVAISALEEMQDEVSIE